MAIRNEEQSDTIIKTAKELGVTISSVQARVIADTLFPEDTIHESNLIKHAERELALAGISTSKDDFSKKITADVLELMRVFSAQDHTHDSAEMVRNIFLQLASWEVITPITDDPYEWVDVTEEMGSKETVHQNLRGPAHFSRDGGKTWKRMDTEVEGTSKKHDAKEETETTE